VVVQAWPHVPQFVALMLVSTHVPLHNIDEPVQPVAHAYVLPEAAHTGMPGGHVMVHPPHVWTLVRSVSQPSSGLLLQCAQRLAHELGGNEQLPPVQETWPLTFGSKVQSCPQAPQLWTSLAAHPPSQLKPGQASAAASAIRSPDASRGDVPPFPAIPWSPPAPALPPDALASCPPVPPRPPVPPWPTAPALPALPPCAGAPASSGTSSVSSSPASFAQLVSASQHATTPTRAAHRFRFIKSLRE
jgi:hypothetical protein